MDTLQKLLDSNKKWAKDMEKKNPGFFDELSQQQSPRYLWIGCADSRVPATEICGLKPGEMFVHRNIANVVVHTDLNCLSVLQYAVEVLKVEHIIVCGHYGCGGVNAALGDRQYGMIDNWLRHVKDIYHSHEQEVDRPGATDVERSNILCELNVKRQVKNIASTTIVQNAWKNGQKLTVHGWIYSLKDGLLKDLDVNTEGQRDLNIIYRMKSGALASMAMVDQLLIDVPVLEAFVGVI